MLKVNHVFGFYFNFKCLHANLSVMNMTYPAFCERSHKTLYLVKNSVRCFAKAVSYKIVALFLQVLQKTDESRTLNFQSRFYWLRTKHRIKAYKLFSKQLIDFACPMSYPYRKKTEDFSKIFKATFENIQNHATKDLVQYSYVPGDPLKIDNSLGQCLDVIQQHKGSSSCGASPKAQAAQQIYQIVNLEGLKTSLEKEKEQLLEVHTKNCKDLQNSIQSSQDPEIQKSYKAELALEEEKAKKLPLYFEALEEYTRIQPIAEFNYELKIADEFMTKPELLQAEQNINFEKENFKDLFNDLKFQNYLLILKTSDQSKRFLSLEKKSDGSFNIFDPHFGWIKSQDLASDFCKLFKQLHQFNQIKSLILLPIESIE